MSSDNQPNNEDKIRRLKAEIARLKDENEKLNKINLDFSDQQQELSDKLELICDIAIDLLEFKFKLMGYETYKGLNFLFRHIFGISSNKYSINNVTLKNTFNELGFFESNRIFSNDTNDRLKSNEDKRREYKNFVSSFYYFLSFGYGKLKAPFDDRGNIMNDDRKINRSRFPHEAKTFQDFLNSFDNIYRRMERNTAAHFNNFTKGETERLLKNARIIFDYKKLKNARSDETKKIVDDFECMYMTIIKIDSFARTNKIISPEYFNYNPDLLLGFENRDEIVFLKDDSDDRNYAGSWIYNKSLTEINGCDPRDDVISRCYREKENINAILPKINMFLIRDYIPRYYANCKLTNEETFDLNQESSKIDKKLSEIEEKLSDEQRKIVEEERDALKRKIKEIRVSQILDRIHLTSESNVVKGRSDYEFISIRYAGIISAMKHMKFLDGSVGSVKIKKLDCPTGRQIDVQSSVPKQRRKVILPTT